jgi:transposase InsO family protein
MENVYQEAGISRQGHHRAVHSQQAKSIQRDDLLHRVRQARLLHPRMGARPLYRLLDIQGIGINRFERLLSASGMSVKRRRNKIKTSDGYLCREKASNKTNGLEITGINRLWVGDITYFSVGSEVFYIFMLMDVYSRRILGANIFMEMTAVNAVKVLKSALSVRGIARYDGTLIHHSDRGSQYMSNAYRQLLSDRGIELSTAENSLQNAYAERINGTIKNDYMQFFHTTNLRELRRHLSCSVKLYNSQRPHSSLGYLTPVAFEETATKTPMKLYDFHLVDEFFSGICHQNGCPCQNQKQDLLRDPAIPVGQGYSSNGCAPAEPISASPWRNKINGDHNIISKKL